MINYFWKFQLSTAKTITEMKEFLRKPLSNLGY